MTEATPKLIPCLVCEGPLELRLTKGRKSGKAGLMLICPRDGRHLRGFITDREYVDRVLARSQEQEPDPGSEVGE